MTETISDDATVLIQHSGSGIRSEMKHLEMYLGTPRKFFRSERTAATKSSDYLLTGAQSASCEPSVARSGSNIN